jgi:acyl-CoA reductase-like NAD-dependent aldehyde dehydrogenase
MFYLRFLDINCAVVAAKRAFPQWSTLSVVERSNYLVAIANEIEVRQDEIARMEVLLYSLFEV